MLFQGTEAIAPVEALEPLQTTIEAPEATVLMAHHRQRGVLILPQEEALQQSGEHQVEAQEAINLLVEQLQEAAVIQGLAVPVAPEATAAAPAVEVTEALVEVQEVLEAQVLRAHLHEVAEDNKPALFYSKTKS